MANQYTIYKSTDASAPVLSGTAGSLVALLDACLVNGYGVKAAAGWAKAFAGANKAAYRAPSGARLYYRVQDDAGGTGGAKEALLRGFETMSDVDTGTGPYPTAGQSALTANSDVIRKSLTADATGRIWIIAADARTVNVFVLSGDTASIYTSAIFGEFYDLLPSDPYNGMVIGRHVENNGATSSDNVTVLSAAHNAVLQGHFFARGHTGTGGSVNFNKVANYGMQGTALGFYGAQMPFPNPSDGGAFLFPVWMSDPTTAPIYGVRGRLRGIWVWGHSVAGISDLDTLSGVGTLAGKTFLFLKTFRSSATATDQIMTIETSATLETN